MILTLPWPAKELSPNSRRHWTIKAKAVKKYRAACFFLAKEALVKGGSINPKASLPLKITFCPPSLRRMDIDNSLASIKSGIDGICDAWGVDDSRFRPITIDFGPTRKGGAVIVEVA